MVKILEQGNGEISKVVSVGACSFHALDHSVSDLRWKLTSYQLIRDSEGILAVWDYLDMFQPVSLDTGATLLLPILYLHLIFEQQEMAEVGG